MDKSRVRYSVDKDNGAVAAEIKYCDLDAMYFLNERIVSNVTSGFTINMPFNCDSKFAMNWKYKAVAKLHPGDEWDEERGKAVACNKLTESYHKGLNKRLAKYAHDFRRIADDIDRYLAKQHD